jgi:parallel beta-helix repeat protein
MVERTLFTTEVPATPQDVDSVGVTLGVRWFSDQPGQVVAIRFYKGGAQGGNSHTVRLYSATGNVLATAVSSGETTSGWQRVNLAAPVPIAANTEYRAAVFWPAGRYAATNSFFASQFNNPPLHAYGSNNGVYTYGGLLAFPTSTWQANNYFVDPVVEIETVLGAPVGYKTIGRGIYPLRETPILRPAAPPPTGHVFYVATTGNDSNPGTQEQPWRSISITVGGGRNLQPGDTIIVMPGTYTEQIWFNDGGDATGYVTLRSQTKHGALLRPPSGAYTTLNLDASYIIIDGFDVVGGDGHGIGLDIPGHHHVTTKNCRAHDSGGSGISMIRGEFFTIEDNICYNNAGTSGFHCSGISIYQATRVAGDTVTTGFRNIVRRNICYNNIETPAIPGDHTDGNGIIIDDTQNTQGGGDPGGYPYPTLVENNLCYDNGSKGIQLAWSDHVTVRNNICYHNNKDRLNQGTWRGEINAAFSDNNTFVNNICWANPATDPNNIAIGDFDNAGGNVNNLWYYNLTFNGTQGAPSWRREGGTNPSLTSNAPYNNVFGMNPLLANPIVNPTSADFRLLPGSPCINRGTSQFGLPSTDLDGKTRVVGAAVDIGCYEAT